jgi:hypothetical protein
VFKSDPGVVPDDRDAKKAGIDIVRTDARHTDMSDQGPDSVKTSIQDILDKFLSEDSDSKLRRPDTNKSVASDPAAMGP